MLSVDWESYKVRRRDAKGYVGVAPSQMARATRRVDSDAYYSSMERNAASSITATPNAFALSNFDPASAPART